MDNWLESLLPVLGEIGLVLVAVVLTAIASYARSWLKEKIGVEKYELLLRKAEALVKWAEQTLEKLPGFEKKEVVMIALRQFAEAIGLMLTDAELDQIIEAQVYQMNADRWPTVQ